MLIQIICNKLKILFQKGLSNMSPEQFTYWLQGYFELEDPKTLDEKKVEMIKKHLNTVFCNITKQDKTTIKTSIQDVLMKSFDTTKYC